jgi:hypothetical protein
MEASRSLYHESYDHYERSIDSEATLAPVRMQHGVCLSRTTRYLRAEEEFRAAAALASVEAWLFFYRVFVAQARAHEPDAPERARALYDKARAVASENVRPLVSSRDFQQFTAELVALERQLRPAR